MRIERNVEKDVALLQIDTTKQELNITELQNNKIDKIKNLFAGLSVSVVSSFGVSGGLSYAVANEVLTANKTVSTPDTAEGFDILIDLSGVEYSGDITLSFKYNDLVYTGSISNQILVTINSKTGTFKRTLGAISKTNSNGVYSINITNDIKSYNLQDGFKIRLSSRDVFSIKVSNFVVGTSIFIEDNPLVGKTIYGDGDSVALGSGSGNVSYLDLIAQKNQMTLTKTAVGGTTIAKREGITDSILERVKAHPEPFDYIVLDGGMNDVFQAVPLGLLSDGYEAALDETTFIGALESLCKELNTVHFGQKCLFILIHKKPGTPNQKTYFDAAITALEKWSIPYIDMRKETNLAAWTTSIGTEWFQEAAGTHPLLNTYKKYYVPLIEARLKTL